MLKEYEDAMRAAAEIAVGADRDTRAELPDLAGQEENYTPAFCARLKDRLNGQCVDGVWWEVHTYTPTKLEEADSGADLVVGLRLKLDGADHVSKGFLAQAKLNQNRERGLRVDSRARLNAQCDSMLDLTQAAYVFGYGTQSTKIIRAQNVLAVRKLSLSKLRTTSLFDFFFGLFNCDWGDFSVNASSSGDLREFARSYGARSAMMIRGRADDTGEGESIRVRSKPPSPDRPRSPKIRLRRRG